MLVRVVNVDFYMNPPISNLDPLYSEFRGSATHQVPILRIFGSTDTGVKTCLHVHGVFPYIYIPYDGSEGAESFMYQLATSLDKAINVSLGQTSSNMQHIFKITLVSGIPFYGYHPKHHQFLKLYFYNPLILKKACALLQNGSIMGRIFQPHEAHIPYILQFMIDYNLYGMSFINISEVKYRNSIDLIDIPEELILPSTIQKMSTCKLEIDGLAENILNRLEVNSQSLGLNPGIQALWDDEKQRRRNVGDNSLVEHCLTQNRTDIEPTATHLAYLNALKEKLRKPAKNEDEDKQNLSVYPAETPKDNTKKILNASTIESHIYSSQSSDSTFLDFTITPEENEANLSLDRDAMELLEVLGDLRENVESDSILSQALPERESDDEEKEEDLSVPLPYVQTPVKSGGENLDQNESDLDECYFDLSISIPQLDGADDLTPTKRGRKTTGVECHAIGAGEGSSGKEECQLLDQISSMRNNNLSLNQSVSKESNSNLYKNIFDMLQNSSKSKSISTVYDLKCSLLHLLSNAEIHQSQNKDVLEILKNPSESIQKENGNRDMKLRNGRAINFNKLNLQKRRSPNKSRQKNKDSTLSSLNETLNELVLEQSDLLNLEMSQLNKNYESQKNQSDKLPELKVQLNDIFLDYKQRLPQTQKIEDAKNEEMIYARISDDELKKNLKRSVIGRAKKRGKGSPLKKNKKSFSFKFKSINDTFTSSSSFDPERDLKRNNSLNESNLILSTTTDFESINSLNLSDLSCGKKMTRRRATKTNVNLEHEKSANSTQNIDEGSFLSEVMNHNVKKNLTDEEQMNLVETLLKESEENSLEIMMIESKGNDVGENLIGVNRGESTNIKKRRRKGRVVNSRRRGRRATKTPNLKSPEDLLQNKLNSFMGHLDEDSSLFEVKNHNITNEEINFVDNSDILLNESKENSIESKEQMRPVITNTGETRTKKKNLNLERERCATSTPNLQSLEDLSRCDDGEEMKRSIRNNFNFIMGHLDEDPSLSEMGKNLTNEVQINLVKNCEILLNEANENSSEITIESKDELTGRDVSENSIEENLGVLTNINKAGKKRRAVKTKIREMKTNLNLECERSATSTPNLKSFEDLSRCDDGEEIRSMRNKFNSLVGHLDEDPSLSEVGKNLTNEVKINLVKNCEIVLNEPNENSSEITIESKDELTGRDVSENSIEGKLGVSTNINKRGRKRRAVQTKIREMKTNLNLECARSATSTPNLISFEDLSRCDDGEEIKRSLRNKFDCLVGDFNKNPSLSAVDNHDVKKNLTSEVQNDCFLNGSKANSLEMTIESKGDELTGRDVSENSIEGNLEVSTNINKAGRKRGAVKIKIREMKTNFNLECERSATSTPNLKSFEDLSRRDDGEEIRRSMRNKFNCLMGDFDENPSLSAIENHDVTKNLTNEVQNDSFLNGSKANSLQMTINSKGIQLTGRDFSENSIEINPGVSKNVNKAGRKRRAVKTKTRKRRATKTKSNVDREKCATSTPNIKKLEGLSRCDDGEEIKSNTQQIQFLCEDVGKNLSEEVQVNLVNNCEIFLKESKENSLEVMIQSEADELKGCEVSKNSILSTEGNPGMSSNINKSGRKRINETVDLESNVNDEKVVKDDENLENLNESKRVRREDNETISPRYITRSRTNSNKNQMKDFCLENVNIDKDVNNCVNDTNLNETQMNDFRNENVDINTIINDLDISTTDTEILQNSFITQTQMKSPKVSEESEIQIIELSSCDNDVSTINNQPETVPCDNNIRKDVGLSMPTLNLNSSITDQKEEKNCDPSKTSCVKTRNGVVKEIDIFRDEDRQLRDYDKQRTIVRKRKRSVRLKEDKKNEVLTPSNTLSEKISLKRKLTNETDQEIKINNSIGKKTIPITVHVPLLEDSFCKSSPVIDKINNSCFTYSTGLYPSPRFKVVESNNRPYSYLPKPKRTSQFKVENFPNTNWNNLDLEVKNSKKQIIMHSCTVLDENQRIDIKTLPMKKSYNLCQSSLFPANNESSQSANYSMSDFSDFQRLVLEEFENCYEENKVVKENEIVFEKKLNEMKRDDVVDLNKLDNVVDEEKLEKSMRSENDNLENFKFISNDGKEKSEALNKLEGTIDGLIEIINIATNNTKDVLMNNQKLTSPIQINDMMWNCVGEDIKTDDKICSKTLNVQEKFNNHSKNVSEVINHQTDQKKIDFIHNNSYKSLQTQEKSNNQHKEINTSRTSKNNLQNSTLNYQQLWERVNKDLKINNDNKWSYKTLKPQEKGNNQFKNVREQKISKMEIKKKESLLINDDLNKNSLRSPEVYKTALKPLKIPGNMDIIKYIKEEAKISSRKSRRSQLNENKLFGFAVRKDVDERMNYPRFFNFNYGRGIVKPSDRKSDIPKYPVNQYDHFDGTNDSSSSDDDIITTVKKITKHIASQSTSKYAPLKVKYTSPTKSVGKSALSRNRSQDKISNVKALTQSTLTTNKSKQSLYKHRRKLSFTQSFETKSNTTQIEEHLSCRLKARRSSKVNEKVYIDCDLSNSSSSSSCNSIGSEREVLPIQLCQTNLDQDESLENDVNEIIEKTDFRDRADYEDISLDDTLTPKKNDSSLSDDLFSPESDEIIICRKIDPAKQYDVENKFIPLAGSSKMDPQFKKISQHSNNSSSSDVITPYQREQNIIIEDVIESVVANNFSENSETSQEYNVDKTGNETISSLHMNTDSVNEIISGRFEKLNTSMLSVYKPTSQNLIKNDETSLKITPKFNPPSREMVETSLESYDIPEVTNQEPFYSDRNDVTGSIEVGRKVLKIPSNNVFDLSTFKTDFEGIESQKKKTLEVLEVDNKKLSAKEILEYKLSTSNNSDVVVTPGKIPPNRKEVGKWLKGKVNKKDVEEEKGKEKKRIFLVNSPGRDGEESCDSLSLSPCTPIDANSTIFKLDLDNDQKCSQNLPKSEPSKSNDTVIKNLSSSTPSNSHEITGTTQANFLVASHNLNEAKAVKENLYLTILSIEVIAITRNEYKPNPELDQIKAIIFTLCDNDNISKGGFIINTLPISPTKTKSSILKGIDSRYNLKPVNTELELINEFVEFVKEKDPDIFVGFEIEMLSWGYLIDRGYVLGLNLTILLSKIPDIPRKKRDDEELAITGRILLDFWRLLRHEIALTSYSFENIVYHILHRRIPLYSHKDLTNWLQHPTAVYRNRVIEYYSYKTRAVLQIMDQLDLIGRTSELAKLFGIQFYEVLSRGSQFRVESMMLRLAKPLNFIPVSPNQQQRAKMRAPESLPLIMEPESKFYTDPVIVLDFQSLYPSMIIAYNYCFSTCLGRIEHLGKSSPFEFGANQLKVSKKYLKYFLNKGKLNISPCGIAFVNKSIRSGILPRMLQEILDTRLMVKKSLKQNAQNKVLSKVLDARQLGLKLIANVTYGYTAANFSGRMPCIELGDSVVSKGRETLQRAIQLVEKTSKWGAKVVYGDTDSLFVLIPGKSKESAFKIGAEIAEAVTNSNPSPVKLKLEKIFQPCILQTKKRYVGYMYESVDQKEPEFLAKGIETVRRDGCPASAKMLEKCLKLLFDTRDVSLIKKYVLRQFAKLLSGRVSIQDLTFAKEYRGASYYRPGACVPALELAKKWTSIDKRNEPRKGERVPYVIINGPPGQPLIKLVKSPRDVLNDSSIRINALYYITKAIIPPLNRCFLLIGADLNQWFNEMPRKQHQYLPTASSSPGKNKTKKTTITQFFSTLDCAICGALTQDGLCEKCKNNPQQSALLLHEKVRLWEQNFFNALQICQSCCGRPDEICCVSLDCPVYYRRIQTNRDLQQSGFIRQILLMLPNLEF